LNSTFFLQPPDLTGLCCSIATWLRRRIVKMPKKRHFATAKNPYYPLHPDAQGITHIFLAKRSTIRNGRNLAEAPKLGAPEQTQF